MKKCLLIALTCVLLFTAFACNKGGGTMEWTEEEPIYQSNREFMIGMWVGVPDSIKEYDPDTGEVIKGSEKRISDEDFLKYYQEIADSGINMAYPGYGESSREYNLRALNAAKSVGIKQLISDPTVTALLMNDMLSEEQVIAQIEEAASYYKDHEAFAGLMIRDEPALNEIANYQIAKEIFDKVFPGKIFYINLLPVIASVSALGGDYTAYIQEYVNKIGTDFVSYDHYPLMNNGRSDYVINNFLYNMDLVKRAAPDKEMWTFLQSIGFNSNRELARTADATFQMYSFLAFGGTGIQWFCYWSPPAFDGATHFEEGMIARDGSKTDTYEYVKTANLELRSFEDIYFNFDWKGIMTEIGTENSTGGENEAFNFLINTQMKSHERVYDMKCQQDTLVGVFEDGDGRDGFMVVNYTAPEKGLSNKVELTFKDCARAIVVKKGVKQIVNATEVKVDGQERLGKISFEMESGEGYFVIPLK